MKKLISIDEYKKIVNNYRKICRRPFSNLYFMPSDIERYIILNRVDYLEKEEGIFFFFDEGNYVRVCFFVDDKKEFSLPELGKTMLVRNVYREEAIGEAQCRVEEKLAEMGFVMAGKTVQVTGNPKEILLNCKSMDKYAKAMEQKGYRCIKADFSRYGEIDSLIKDSGIIKEYHMVSRTEEEKKALEEGSYLCMIDAENRICGGSIMVIKDGVAEGEAVAIPEAYKMRGIAPVLTYKRLQWLCENNVEYIQGWILVNNDASIRYHKSLGYTFRNKFANEWLREVGNGN